VKLSDGGDINIMQGMKRLFMKIGRIFSAPTRVTTDSEREKLKQERMERKILNHRIRTMDMEIDNIGRREE
jgi:hypothetical protein